MDFLLQGPPQPLQFWPDPPPVPANFARPATFRDKHFGQWCRNITLDRHIQCPRASPFHWYLCCGEDGTECCFGIQTWVYIIFGSLALTFLAVALFSVALAYLPRSIDDDDDDDILRQKRCHRRQKATHMQAPGCVSVCVSSSCDDDEVRSGSSPAGTLMSIATPSSGKASPPMA